MKIDISTSTSLSCQNIDANSSRCSISWDNENKQITTSSTVVIEEPSLQEESTLKLDMFVIAIVFLMASMIFLSLTCFLLAKRRSENRFLVDVEDVSNGATREAFININISTRNEDNNVSQRNDDDSLPDYSAVTDNFVETNPEDEEAPPSYDWAMMSNNEEKK